MNRDDLIKLIKKYEDYLIFHPWTYPAGKEHDNCEERFKKIIEGLKAQL